MSCFRDSQQLGRLRLRHLLETTEATGERMDADRPRFQRLAREDSAPRVVSAFNLFQTPEPLAARLAEPLAADRPALGHVLEPSAGLGRLYRAVRAREPACPCTLVEIAADCAAELYRQTDGDPAARLVQGDFLAWQPAAGPPVDSVLMNPPFKQGRDVQHIAHALAMLAPGGRLVGLCASGPRQHAKLKPLADQWHEIPAGTFDGTAVRAAIVVIDKPHHPNPRS